MNVSSLRMYKAAALLGLAPWLFTVPADAQIINAGLKAGFNYSWTTSDNYDFRKNYDIAPVTGVNAGGVLAFQLKQRYYLHTELLYATKGRRVTGEEGLKEKVTYNYIELPLMYQVHFKGHMGAKGMKQFKWYLEFGPNFSYWLGGKGTITHLEVTELDASEINYQLYFGQRTEDRIGNANDVFISDARRIQVGVNIGGGVMLEPADNRKIMIDLRFELGHSWLGGEESADYLVPASYSTNLQSRNMGLRLSAMYLLQTNTDKKVRNKGKSTIKKKGGQLQRRR